MHLPHDLERMQNDHGMEFFKNGRFEAQKYAYKFLLKHYLPDSLGILPIIFARLEAYPGVQIDKS